MTEPVQDWANHSLFAGLPPRYLESLSHAARVESFDPQEPIFHEGDAANEFYLIHRGNVTIEVFLPERGAVTIQTVGNGDVLGWSWLIEPYQWHFDAHATTRTEVVAFDATSVREGFKADAEFGYLMMKRFVPIIVQRLQATRLQLLDVYHARIG
jgi:CRP-like cAMP-binding protein